MHMRHIHSVHDFHRIKHRWMNDEEYQQHDLGLGWIGLDWVGLGWIGLDWVKC